MLRKRISRAPFARPFCVFSLMARSTLPSTSELYKCQSPWMEVERVEVDRSGRAPCSLTSGSADPKNTRRPHEMKPIRSKSLLLVHDVT